MERTPLAMRLRAFRKLKGHTQADLARILGISIAVLGSIERGARKPDARMIQRISAALGIEAEELQTPKVRVTERG